jgi:hypothetical protein
MSPTDATTVYTSLWQDNLVGLRAERFINWKKANANACYYLTDAVYPFDFGPGGAALTQPAAGSGPATKKAKPAGEER